MLVLDVEVMGGARALSLRLADAHGRHLGASQVRLDDHAPRAWEGIFDARSYVRRFAGVLRRDGEATPLSPVDIVGRIGAFLGRHVLGPAIMGALSSGIQQRALVVRLPDPGGSPLAAALARVPWEIARPARGDEPEGASLMERNVVVRAVPAGTPPSVAEVALALPPDEALRVLLVYAEAPGSRPLSARLERERLLSLFASEVMPKRRVAVDTLCHGVTRERLRAQIQGAGGYHIVHWSGHGAQDALELATSGDSSAEEAGSIRGAELVDIFARAGGFIPRLFFLSACRSGSIADASDWAALQAALRDRKASLQEDKESGVAEPSLERVLEEPTGRTGVALELHRAGVPQIVAMRFDVGDTYARELAQSFYRLLLAQPRTHAVDAALAMAQRELLSSRGGEEYHPLDHATPLLIGASTARFEPAATRSPQIDRLRPRPQPLLGAGRRDLDPRPDFVGRGAEMARLSSTWLASGGAPLAWIEGAPAIGKTSLAAEIIHLWHSSFDFVIALQQEGPEPPSIAVFYRHVAERLTRASPAYRERCRANELAKIYVEPGSELSGEAWSDLLRDNLADAMLAERILLVLDALDADASWESLLRGLSQRLAGSGSRVLVTSRRALPDGLADPSIAIRAQLGPLSEPENELRESLQSAMK